MHSIHNALIDLCIDLCIVWGMCGVQVRTLDIDGSGAISRSEWREGLARFREAKAKTGAELGWMAPMMLEAVIRPVRPPRDEEFKDLKPLGSNYRSDNFKGKVWS